MAHTKPLQNVKNESQSIFFQVIKSVVVADISKKRHLMWLFLGFSTILTPLTMLSTYCSF